MAAISDSVDVSPGTGTGIGSASLTISVAFTIGSQTVALNMPRLANTVSPCQIQQVDLTATTEKLITVPSTAVGVLVTPPSSNTALWQYRTNTGVAEQTRKVGTLDMPFDGAVPASFYLYCASTVSGFRVVFY